MTAFTWFTLAYGLALGAGLRSIVVAWRRPRDRRRAWLNGVLDLAEAAPRALAAAAEYGLQIAPGPSWAPEPGDAIAIQAREPLPSWWPSWSRVAAPQGELARWHGDAESWGAWLAAMTGAEAEQILAAAA